MDISDDSYPRLPHFEAPETPGPVRARVNNLQGQISDLIRREQTASRKHKSDVSSLEQTVAQQKTELAATHASLASVRATLDVTQKELARCQDEGNGMKDELNLQSVVHQQRALLVLAQEQLQVIELERRLVQAEAARVMRDHKIALFQAKEEDLLAELAERDAQLDELIASSSSNTQSKTSSEKALRQQLERANEERSTLESKVDKLESTVKVLRQREKEARAELDGWLREEKGKESGADKEKRDLQVSLRTTKKELDKKTQELEDVQEELQTLKESSREREKSLKAKLKAAALASAAASEDDEPVPSRPTKRPSPKKVEKPKARKASTPPVSEDEPSPKKVKTKTVVSKTRSEPLVETAQNREKATIKKPTVVVEDVDEDSGGPKKKKRTLLGKTQPNFNWDSIMNSGDGMIPSMLSPMKPPGTTSAGTIPRAGFVGFPSSKSLARF